MRAIRRKWLVWGSLLAGLVALYVAHLLTLYSVRRALYSGRVAFREPATEMTLAALAERSRKDETFATLEAPRPFLEIQPFDDNAKHWSGVFSHYMPGGVVFDANGDGRLDVYLCNNGQNYIRPTDEDGVLLDRPHLQHSALYLNMGNDVDGRPIFKQVSELVKENDPYAEQELLIEDYLFPRKTPSESEDRPGRQGHVAVAADFNGDGRLDLLVGNMLPGMPFSHPQARRIMWKFVWPVGREIKESRLAVDPMDIHLVNHQPRLSIFDERESARGRESVGANSLYLNLGDRDGDGIPEWRDISREAGIEGHGYTTSLSVADVDLDGDLDIYEANA